MRWSCFLDIQTRMRFKMKKTIKKIDTLDDCLMCTDDGYRINRDGYTLCKQHYNEVEDLFLQIEKNKKPD